MPKPRIALPIPTSFDLEYNQQAWPQYAAAVEQSGGEAVEVALNLSPARIADLMNTCQGIVLPGSGADVSPRKYGQDAIEACAAPDPARENVDELLIQDAYNLHKPILAICFGLQSLNVWRGGTLVQDLTVMPVNHAAGGSVAVAHSLMVAPDSILGGLLSPDEAPMLEDGFLRLPVNSSHHQAIGVPGDGLRIVARCPQDGVIEAVEGDLNPDGASHFVLAVQWHPERSYTISAASRAIFARLVAEAAAWAPSLVDAHVA
jgi:putative glutamine amidotransferase